MSKVKAGKMKGEAGKNSAKKDATTAKRKPFSAGSNSK